MKNWTGCACSCTGSSHIRAGRECQDSSMFMSGSRYVAVMVADGHGSRKHFRSATGSQIAKEICKRIVPEYAASVRSYKDQRQLEKTLKNFEKHMIYSWREEVENELIMDPFTEGELSEFNDGCRQEIEEHPHVAFGTTLILAIAAGDYLQIIQLGDGDCRVRTRNGIEKPLPEDNSLQFGRTTSMCNEDAFDRIRDIVLPLGTVKACLLSSDGVLNSFDMEEHFCDFMEVLVKEFKEEDCDAESELKTFLPDLSAKGSGDDVSVAVIVRKPAKTHSGTYPLRIMMIS